MNIIIKKGMQVVEMGGSIGMVTAIVAVKLGNPVKRLALRQILHF